MPLDREGRKDIEASVLSLAAEVCQRYRLIADYFQRPQMNEIFARQTNELRREYIPENIEGVNNEYFPKWLGPVFVAAYIALDAQNVFDATISLGTFLATISVMKDISSEFADAYTLILDLAGTFGSIQYLTTYFNKETDLLTWKGVNRTRRELTPLSGSDRRSDSDVGAPRHQGIQALPVRKRAKGDERKTTQLDTAKSQKQTVRQNSAGHLRE